jgi:hypothetical protein
MDAPIGGVPFSREPKVCPVFDVLARQTIPSLLAHTDRQIRLMLITNSKRTRMMR